MLTIVLVAAGCADPDLGFGVAMSLVFDDTVSDQALASVKNLSFTSSGDESFAKAIALDHPAARNERTIYRPLVTTRSLSLAVSALDGPAGAVIASGHSAALTLTPGGTTAVSIILASSSQGACTSSAECDNAHVCGATASCELPLTCRALKRAHDAAPDGHYTIAPDGEPRDVYCDMTKEGGGWMLVTPDMVASETSTSLLSDSVEVDPNGGLIMTLRPKAAGCNTTTPNPKHVVLFKDVIAWQQIRYRSTFTGAAGCWSIFGDPYKLGTLDPNVSAFNKAYDTIRDEVHMGGTAGDAFDGMTNRCDQTTVNFWEYAGPDRSAVVTLRRKPNANPAGLSGRAECLTEGPTGWSFSEIYVREN
jgi:hypothetical protein